MNDLSILREMVMTFGISGFEDEMRDKIREMFPNVEFGEDDVGNLYATVGEEGKSIAFVAHMDEIGFVISYVEKNGYLRFRPVGGWDVRSVYNRIMEIKTQEGIVHGVIGLKPPHLSKKEEMEKTLSWDDLFVDIGVDSEDEARKMGIIPILPARLKKDFVIINDSYIITRALDDRVGCALNILLLKHFLENPPPNKITVVWTVQEETGLRGAKAFASRHSFDEVYVIDTVSAGNLPWGGFHQSPVRTGGGPVIRLVDRRGVSSLKLRKFVKKLAEKNGISVQEVATGGSTDAAATYEFGLNSLPICIPVKYTHSPVEMMSIADYRRTYELLVKIGEKER